MRVFLRVRKIVSYPVFPLLVALIFAASVQAQEEGGDLRSKVQNPVGSLISVPFKNTLDFGAPDGKAYVMNLQPVIPVTVGAGT